MDDCVLFVTEEPLAIVKPLQEVTVTENEPSVLICELNKPDIQVQWTKEGETIVPTENVKVTCAGMIHTLTIEKTTLDDEAEYALAVGELTTKAEILVDGESDLKIICTFAAYSSASHDRKVSVLLVCGQTTSH